MYEPGWEDVTSSKEDWNDFWEGEDDEVSTHPHPMFITNSHHLHSHEIET